MTKFLFVAAILSLSIVNARFASAQAAVGEPGMYQFYHPDGDVLHVGPGYAHAESLAMTLRFNDMTVGVTRNVRA